MKKLLAFLGGLVQGKNWSDGQDQPQQASKGVAGVRKAQSFTLADWEAQRMHATPDNYPRFPSPSVLAHVDNWVSMREWVDLLRDENPEQIHYLCKHIIEQKRISSANHNFWNAVVDYHYNAAYCSFFSTADGDSQMLEAAQHAESITRSLRIYDSYSEEFEKAWAASRELAQYRRTLLDSGGTLSKRLNEWGQPFPES